MALMTTCPACSTHFKVVPDQLRLHHGLVRCGTCDHVFDANTRLEAIVDDGHSTLIKKNVDPLDSPEAWINKPAVVALAGNNANALQESAWTEIKNRALKTRARRAFKNTDDDHISGLSEAQTSYPTKYPTTDHSAEQSAEQSADQTSVFTREFKDSEAVLNSQNSGAVVSIARKSSYPMGTFGDSQRYKALDPDDALAVQAAARQAERRRRRASKKRAEEQAALDLQAQPDFQTQGFEPNFAKGKSNKHAKRSKRREHQLNPQGAWLWAGNTGRVSAKQMLLTLALVLAALGVMAQGLLMARYTVADNWPSAKPLLLKLCAYTDCEVEPAPWLQPLSLDALTLTKTNQSVPNVLGLQAYRVQATVRNSSQLWIKKPDIELTITNTHSAIIARKTLHSSLISYEQNAVQGVVSGLSAVRVEPIKPGSDWLVDTTLLLDEQTVGYTARVVYAP